MKTQDLWAALSAQPFPCLHELAWVDQDRFVLLDAICVIVSKNGVFLVASFPHAPWCCSMTVPFAIQEPESPGWRRAMVLWAIQETGQAGLARRRYGAGI